MLHRARWMLLMGHVLSFAVCRAVFESHGVHASHQGNAPSILLQVQLRENCIATSPRAHEQMTQSSALLSAGG